MSEVLLYRLSVTAAAVVGASGFVLALLVRRRFEDAPFGRALAVLPPLMFSFSLYHVLLIAAPGLHEVAELFEVVAFLLLALFVVLMIRVHARMSRPSMDDGTSEESG